MSCHRLKRIGLRGSDGAKGLKAFFSTPLTCNEVASMHNRFPRASIFFSFWPTGNPFRCSIMKLKPKGEISSRRNTDARRFQQGRATSAEGEGGRRRLDYLNFSRQQPATWNSLSNSTAASYANRRKVNDTIFEETSGPESSLAPSFSSFRFYVVDDRSARPRTWPRAKFILDDLVKAAVKVPPLIAALSDLFRGYRLSFSCYSKFALLFLCTCADIGKKQSAILFLLLDQT